MRLSLVALPLAVLSGSAHAGDLPRRDPATVAATAPPFTWTGPYSGLFAGYGGLDNTTAPVCTGSGGLANGLGCPIRSRLSPRADDFIAGSEIGYDLQVAPGSGLVLGAAADYQFTPIRAYGIETGDFRRVGLSPRFFYPDGIYHTGQRLDWLGTARGKVGYAFDRVLVYATGGLAFGEVRIDTNTVANPFARNNDQPDFDGRKGDLRFGCAAGGGVEYAIGPHLSVKSEVLYYDLGTRNVTARDSSGVAPVLSVGTRAVTSGVLGRVGLDYRFDDGGVPVIGPISDVVTALLESVPYIPPVAQVWDFEIGARYFYNTGTFRKTIASNLDPTVLNSRLTYRGFPAQSGESFARLDHNPTGLFAKGFLGSGFVTSGGRLNDEDFPPYARPYSNTVSKIKDGDTAFATIDAGYSVLRGEGYKLGAFVGYQYLTERADAYGLFQIASNRQFAGRVPFSVATLSQDNHWNALRVGLAGEARYDRLKLSLEGAYLPIADVTGYDRHWLRPDINPLAERGRGDGYFLQGVISYDLTPTVSVGVGGRAVRMAVAQRDGGTQFPYLQGLSQESYRTTRYGAFAQIAYRFTDPDFGLGALVAK